MSVFVDTNVLLRVADPGDPRHGAAVSAVSILIEAGEALWITPQIAAEFWCVATRPVQNNGLGMTSEETRDEISRLEGFFSVLPRPPMCMRSGSGSLLRIMFRASRPMTLASSPP
ncbi:MAG: hypothetical protein QM736_29810 [Vicinamibacterales bacterium]